MAEINGAPQSPIPRPRPTARLIVLDDSDRLLLFKVEDDSVFDPLDPRGVDRPTIVWTTPGGGVEPGETYEDAARRELWEEAGMSGENLGPCLHEEEWLLYFHGRPVLLQQRYFLVRAAAGVVSLDGLNAAELESYRDHRWWTLAELQTTVEEVFPVNLADIVRRALDMR